MCWPAGAAPRPSPPAAPTAPAGPVQVEVLAGADQLTPLTDREAATKKATGVPEHLRLGCQAGVLGAGVEVRIINVFGEEPNV